MAGSPIWKVYDEGGNYIAACKHLEDAAALCAAHGDGTTIRHGHGRTYWREGKEDFPAFESYDGVAEVVLQRVTARAREKLGIERAPGA